MFDWLQPKIYVRFAPNRLTLRLVGKGVEIDEAPLLAIRQSGGGQLLAIGDEARQFEHQPDIRVINPFTHPRALLSDFTCAEALLKGQVKKLLAGTAWFRLQPVIVMHPSINPEGGFTQIEIRAMHELALGAGASKVTLCLLDAELSDDELRNNAFPADGKLQSGETSRK